MILLLLEVLGAWLLLGVITAGALHGVKVWFGGRS